MSGEVGDARKRLTETTPDELTAFRALAEEKLAAVLA